MIARFRDAIQSGDVETVSQYPELVNEKYDDATALHFAALNGHMACVRWLVDHGANMEARDNEFHATPLVWANERGHTAIVEFLLERGAPLTEWSAVSTGNLERLQQIVAADPDVLGEERDFGTLLHQACIWGQADVVDWLIDRGLDPVRKSQHGYTPLELAQRQSRDGRSHAPLVTAERRARIEKNCALIAIRLRNLPATMPSQGEHAS